MTECPDSFKPILESEKDFTKRVTQHFKDQKHEILKNTKLTHFNCDIVSVKGNITYYTEVKRDLGHHRMQTAIGQLTYYKAILKDYENKHKYQIVFPKQFETNRHFSNDFKTYLHDKMKIEVIFI